MGADLSKYPNNSPNDHVQAELMEADGVDVIASAMSFFLGRGDVRARLRSGAMVFLHHTLQFKQSSEGQFVWLQPAWERRTTARESVSLKNLMMHERRRQCDTLSQWRQWRQWRLGLWKQYMLAAALI